MSEKSTTSDDYKEIGTSNIPSSKTEQGPEVNGQTTDNNESRGYESKPIKNKISGKVPGSLTEVAKEGKNAFRKTFSFGNRQDKSSGIKSIILGLFALIGFIILVYSIFIAVNGEPLADTVFIAALIGSFTLVATIISYQFIKR